MRGDCCRADPSRRVAGKPGAIHRYALRTVTAALNIDPDFPIDPARLPSDWTIALLGDVVDDVRQGFASGEHTDAVSGIPHLRPMNIDRQGRINLDDLKYVPALSDLRVRRGDVLFNNTNSTQLVGKTAPVDLDGDWAFSNHMTRLRPPTGIAYRFLAYQLHYLWREGYFRLRCTQHVNQASISARTLTRSIPIALAPSNQQLQAVAELDRHTSQLDDADRSLMTALQGLAAYRLRVLRLAASGRLVPTDAAFAQAANRQYESGTELLQRLRIEHRERWEEAEQDRLKQAGRLPASDKWKARYRPPKTADPTTLAQLPEGWAWATVSEVGEVTLGRQRAPQYHYGEHMRPYLRVANVLEDRIDTSDVLEMNFSPAEFAKYSLQRGDILLNEGQSPELVGRPAMYRDEVPGACFQKTLLRFRAHAGMSPSFAMVVFRDYLHTGRFRQEAKWSTNIAHLTERRFAGMEFPLPPLAEQERIAAEATALLETGDEVERTLRQCKDKIDHARFVAHQRAFRGAFSSVADDDEPAAELINAIQRLRKPDDARRPVRSRPPREGGVAMQRRSLLAVLSEEGPRLTPEELLARSGIGEDLIDDFYAELKREVALGRLAEFREHGRIYLAIIESVS